MTSDSLGETLTVSSLSPFHRINTMFTTITLNSLCALQTLPKRCLCCQYHLHATVCSIGNCLQKLWCSRPNVLLFRICLRLDQTQREKEERIQQILQWEDAPESIYSSSELFCVTITTSFKFSQTNF